MRQHGSPLSTVRAWRYGAGMAQQPAMPLSGDCQSPVYREVYGHEDALLAKLRQWRSDATIDAVPGQLIGEWSPARQDTGVIAVRCRKCDACLWHRRKQWTAKAIAETVAARRTWFVTLTYSPEHRFVRKCQAESIAVRRRAEHFGTMTPDERFRAIADVCGKDVTLWLKRVRKISRARLRYMLVSEKHADGFPHFHLLIHEADNGSVTKRNLQLAWGLGFTSAKLVEGYDPKAAKYACKYLTKSAGTRMRASQHYGQPKGLVLHVDGVLNTIIAAARSAGTKPSSSPSEATGDEVIKRTF